jgi:hypothetical protein
MAALGTKTRLFGPRGDSGLMDSRGSSGGPFVDDGWLRHVDQLPKLTHCFKLRVLGLATLYLDQRMEWHSRSRRQIKQLPAAQVSQAIAHFLGARDLVKHAALYR